MSMTQKERILRHLQDVGTITSAEAMYEYGIGHLASRISEMRQNGVPIKSETESSTNRYGEKISYSRYRLEV